VAGVAVWKREEWVKDILKARGRVTTASEIEKTSDGTVLDWIKQVSVQFDF